MTKTFSIRLLAALSCNPKSRIANPKLVGLVALGFTFAFSGVGVRAQQPKKVPQLGYLALLDPAAESARAKEKCVGARAAICYAPIWWAESPLSSGSSTSNWSRLKRRLKT